jgi:hypothetical protein
LRKPKYCTWNSHRPNEIVYWKLNFNLYTTTPLPKSRIVPGWDLSLDMLFSCQLLK